MIARPSYGGEREPDSHPTPGPPALVQPARVQPALPGPAPRSSPGVVRSLGRLPAVQFAGRRPETDLSPGAWVAAGTAGAPWLTVAAVLPRGFPAYRSE